MALLGPNGAGKTTLLSVVSGLVHTRRGSIRLNDVDVSALSADERVRRGLCHVTECRAQWFATDHHTVRRDLPLA